MWPNPVTFDLNKNTKTKQEERKITQYLYTSCDIIIVDTDQVIFIKLIKVTRSVRNKLSVAIVPKTPR